MLISRLRHREHHSHTQLYAKAHNAPIHMRIKLWRSQASWRKQA